MKAVFYHSGTHCDDRVLLPLEQAKSLAEKILRAIEDENDETIQST